MRSTKADFVFGKLLGTGTYGVVWQAVRNQDGKTYAVKELDLRDLQKQVSILAHPGLSTLTWTLGRGSYAV